MQNAFGNFLGPLSDLFFWVLRFLHESLGVSWSWAIVLLTVIVRIILIPLTWRQIKSMRAMQALQPQIKALQERYKDDRNLLNQKTMEFYRENHVSPFGSCLPLLLQLPVFLGLYYMLREQGMATWLPEMEVGAFASVWHSAPVGWLWIPDITKFDIILMFLYIASQFVASWQMARKGAGQQKMIAYFMPVVVGIFMFIGKWPAGLFIYWFTSNLWTVAQQYIAERFMPIHQPVGVTSAKDEPASGRPSGKKPSGPTGRKPTGPTGKKPATPSGSKPGGPTGKKPGGSTGKKPAGSAGKSGGKSGGQETRQEGKTAGGKSQRPDGGTGRPKGSG